MNSKALFTIVLALSLTGVGSLGILAMSEPVDANPFIYTGGPNTSTAENPYDAVIVNDPLSVSSEIYVRVGASVTMLQFSAHETDGWYACYEWLTEGFGLTENYGDITGTITKVGTITYTVSQVFPDHVSEDNRLCYIYAVASGTVDFNSLPADNTVSGNTWSYTPVTTPSDASISITGADWLSVSGRTISGTAPVPASGTASQAFTLTITASKDGYTSADQTVTIVVIRDASTSTPVPVFSVTNLGNGSYRFDASASTDCDRFEWDFGDGTFSDAMIVEHSFPMGIFNISLRGENGIGAVTVHESIVVSNNDPPIVAGLMERYIYTFSVSVSSTPVLTGVPWLQIDSYGSDFVIVSGIPESKAYLYKTYDAVLSMGSTVIKAWSIYVDSGSIYPVADFTVSVDGLSVVVKNTSINAVETWYLFGDGTSEIRSITSELKYTYAQAGTYTITQTVKANIDGATMQDSYSRTVTISEPAIVPGDNNNEGGSFDKIKDSIVEFVTNNAFVGLVLVVLLLLVVAFYLKKRGGK